MFWFVGVCLLARWTGYRFWEKMKIHHEFQVGKRKSDVNIFAPFNFTELFLGPSWHLKVDAPNVGRYRNVIQRVDKGEGKGKKGPRTEIRTSYLASCLEAAKERFPNSEVEFFL